MTNPGVVQRSNNALRRETETCAYVDAYLVARGTPGLQGLRVVSTAVDVVVFAEIDEVDQHLLAHVARETRRMPRRAGADSARRHRHVAGLQRFLTL